METVLRAWSTASIALLLVGMVLWFYAPHHTATSLVLDGGLVLLLATPVVKLVSVLADEIRAREWRFAGLGVAVLLLLAGSAMLAFQ
jgi:predicted permease